MNRGKTIMRLGMILLVWVMCIPGTAAAADDAGTEAAHQERMKALGLRYHNAWDLYQGLKQAAGGGKPLAWNSIPDWSGLYTRAGFVWSFDPDLGEHSELVTAKLKPEYRKKFMEKFKDLEAGVEYDRISDCGPPGHPRWMTEPFLRELVVTPHQTWLINEMVNDIRRIYTDGRGHIPEDERYPLYNGDSIGFWDGDKLVIHTNQLMAGQYQRRQPDYSDQVETVEIWRKVDAGNIKVDIWVYDPVTLEEPWYTRQQYARLDDQDKQLRIRYWNCNENPNNEVYETKNHTSQFKDLSFTLPDAAGEKSE
jgi:hypothetical protein